jgi:site-specific recombinase XerD
MRFIKLMKHEPAQNKKKKRNSWIIDESKCLSIEEVRKLRKFCNQAKNYGLQHRKFAPVRNWFMVELALGAGLRIGEMTSLRHGNLFIDKTRCSISFIGKGKKPRAPWISSGFKKTCREYIDYKRIFGYGTNPEDYLMNNQKGITEILQKHDKKSRSARALLHSLPKAYLYYFSAESKQQQLQICTGAIRPCLNTNNSNIRKCY